MDKEYTNIIRTLRLTIKDGRDEEMKRNNISEPICLGGMKRHKIEVLFFLHKKPVLQV